MISCKKIEKQTKFLVWIFFHKPSLGGKPPLNCKKPLNPTCLSFRKFLFSTNSCCYESDTISDWSVWQILHSYRNNVKINARQQQYYISKGGFQGCSFGVWLRRAIKVSVSFRQGTHEKQIPLLCHDLAAPSGAVLFLLGCSLQSPDDVWCKCWGFWVRIFLLHAVFSSTGSISIRCLYQTGLVLLDSLTLLSLFTFHSSWSWMLLPSTSFFLSSSFRICPSALSTVRFKPLNDQSLSTSLCCIWFPLLTILSVFLLFMQDAAAFSVLSLCFM